MNRNAYKEYKLLHISYKHPNKHYKPDAIISEIQGYQILAAIITWWCKPVLFQT